jgi:hypothetical protein
MNGKVARALRHLKAETLNIRDVGILSRRMALESSKIGKGPKPLVTRVRKASGVNGPQGYRLARTCPVIVQNPMRFIKHHIAITGTSIRDLTSGYAKSMRDANALPKHVLDGLASGSSSLRKAFGGAATA